VGGVALVDRALIALGALTGSIAVNAHHRADQLVAHVGGRAHVPHEDRLLGTGGALGGLRDWIAGRPVLVVNGDAVHEAPLTQLVDGWDGQRIRFLLAEPPGTRFAPGVRLCGALMPWSAVAGLAAEPASIHDEVWAPWSAAGRVEAVAGYDQPWFDCGTPASYLAANLWVSGGASVVGAGAEVRGELERAVVWDGARVDGSERLVDAIRTTGGRTVLVRWRASPPAATTASRWTS
jgi:hypothetical protein